MIASMYVEYTRRFDAHRPHVVQQATDEGREAAACCATLFTIATETELARSTFGTPRDTQLGSPFAHRHGLQAIFQNRPSVVGNDPFGFGALIAFGRRSRGPRARHVSRRRSRHFAVQMTPIEQILRQPRRLASGTMGINPSSK